MNTLGRIKIRYRLWKMTRALKIKLGAEQRKMVCGENRPMLSNWARRTGKTICATLWMFLHTKETVTLYNLENYLPDPDLYEFNGDQILPYPSIRRKEWALANAIAIKGELGCKGVNVECTLVSPKLSKENRRNFCTEQFENTMRYRKESEGTQ